MKLLKKHYSSLDLYVPMTNIGYVPVALQLAVNVVLVFVDSRHKKLNNACMPIRYMYERSSNTSLIKCIFYRNFKENARWEESQRYV